MIRIVAVRLFSSFFPKISTNENWTAGYGEIELCEWVKDTFFVLSLKGAWPVFLWEECINTTASETSVTFWFSRQPTDGQIEVREQGTLKRYVSHQLLPGTSTSRLQKGVLSTLTMVVEYLVVDSVSLFRSWDTVPTRENCSSISTYCKRAGGATALVVFSCRELRHL